MESSILTKQQWLSLMKTEVRPKTEIVKGISAIKEDEGAISITIRCLR